MERTVVARACVWIAFVATLASCTIERPADIASIAIEGDACDRCASYVSIDRSGRVRADATVLPDGALDPRYGDVFARFPWDEFLGARDRPDVAEPARLVILTVAYRDGTFQRAPVAIGRSATARTGRLASWTTSTAFEADGARLGHRRRAIDAALRTHALREVVLDELGCYGSCAMYTATFEANGSATMRERCYGVVRRAHARVAFARVLDAADGLQWLRPVYPVRAIDTQGARVTVVTRAETFVAYGPDRMAWDAPFADAEGRLDQLTRDLAWNPRAVLACPAPGSAIVLPRMSLPRTPSKNGASTARIHARRESSRTSRMAFAATHVATRCVRIVAAHAARGRTLRRDAGRG